MSINETQNTAVSPFKSHLNYSKTREFLRLFYLYGCYSKEDFSEIAVLHQQIPNMNKSSIDKYTLLIESYFHRNDYTCPTIGGKKHFKMSYDYYRKRENFLVGSYLTKSSKKHSLPLYFFILQLLYEKKEGLSQSQLFDEIPSSLEISMATLGRQLKKMIEWGILQQPSRGLYAIAEDFFTSFDNEELIDLYYCIIFFAHWIFPHTIGYYLKDTLLQYMKWERDMDADLKDIFLFRFLYFHPVLDEEYSFQLMQSIDSRKQVSFTYMIKGSNNSHKDDMPHQPKLFIFPLKLVADYTYGRWYLYGINDEGKINTYRLDRMKDLVEEPKSFDKKKYVPLLERNLTYSWNIALLKGEAPILVSFKIITSEEYILDKIKKEGKWGSIKDIDGDKIFSIQVNDPLEMKPWLRSLHPHILLFKSSYHDLYETIEEELEEMLVNYGAI